MNCDSSSASGAAKMGTASWRPITAPAQAARQGKEAAFRKARRLKARLVSSGRARGVREEASRRCKSYFIAIRLPPRNSRLQIQNSKSCGPYFIAIGLPPPARARRPCHSDFHHLDVLGIVGPQTV